MIESNSLSANANDMCSITQGWLMEKKNEVNAKLFYCKWTLKTLIIISNYYAKPIIVS